MYSQNELDGLERFSFGDGPKLADSLLELVLEGAKTATCWAAREGELTHIGKQMIVCDGSGEPRAVLETISLQRRRFRDVDEEFARLEGEGDRSLSWWRDAHRAYFERNGGFSEDMELWCEQFRIVQILRSEG